MKKKGSSGYSLLEVLVAGVIIALSVIAVIAIVRKGQEMILLDKHRRMARAYIEQELQKNIYRPGNYPNLGAVTSPSTTNVTIDPKSNLTGTLTVTIGNEATSNMTGLDGTTVAVPYRTVTMTVTWNEWGGPSETVSIDRWITYCLNE